MRGSLRARPSPRSGLLTAFLGRRNASHCRETPPRESPLRNGTSISARNRCRACLDGDGKSRKSDRRRGSSVPWRAHSTVAAGCHVPALRARGNSRRARRRYLYHFRGHDIVDTSYGRYAVRAPGRAHRRLDTLDRGGVRGPQGPRYGRDRKRRGPASMEPRDGLVTLPDRQQSCIVATAPPHHSVRDHAHEAETGRSDRYLRS